MTTYTLKRKTFASARAMDAMREIVANPRGMSPGEVENARNILKRNGETFALTTTTTKPKNNTAQPNTQPNNTTKPNTQPNNTTKPNTTNTTQTYTSKQMAEATAKGRKAGRAQVGAMGGFKNTWNKAGTMGKAGIVAGGLTLGGLALKGATSLGKD